MARKRELTVEKWAWKIEGTRDAMLSLDFDSMSDRDIYRMVDVVFEVQMAMAWKNAGMQVYDFDGGFADSILGEKWVEMLPDCIESRPHDCFYMKLPCGPHSEGTVVLVADTRNIVGFNPEFFEGCLEGKGVYFGGDPMHSDVAERVVVNTGERLLSLCTFAIPREFGMMVDDTEVEVYPLDLVANGVAYICSANADILPSYRPARNARRNNAKKRSMATWHEVGYRIGVELRAYERAMSERSPHQGGTKRPHMRRAHWHHYWIGPRDGERKLELRWLAPTMVGTGKIESATGHKVR